VWVRRQTFSGEIRSVTEMFVFVFYVERGIRAARNSLQGGGAMFVGESSSVILSGGSTIVNSAAARWVRHS
jgi:hypothetical protein